MSSVSGLIGVPLHEVGEQIRQIEKFELRLDCISVSLKSTRKTRITQLDSTFLLIAAPVN